MWLSDRRTFLLGILGLGACGFTPVYGPDSALRSFQNAVRIQAPTTRQEFELVKALEHRFGPATKPAFTLTYSLGRRSESVVVSTAQELNRFNLIGTLSYKLNALDGGLITESQVQAFTSFSGTGSTLATNRSERDADDRLVVILADKMMTQLSTVSIP